MVMPSVAWAVSMSGVSALTVTPSATPPTVSFKSTRVVSPTDTIAFSCATGLNPASDARTEYSPGCSKGKEKYPSAPLTVCRTRVVAALTASIAAPGSTPPD